MSDTGVYRQTKGDAAALWLFLVTGAVIIGWAVVHAVVRIVQILPNRDITIMANFTETTARAAIGPHGTTYPVVLESAAVTVEQLPWASLGALVMQEAVGALAIAVAVGCLLWLTASVLRGTIFSRRNTVLVTLAGLAAVGGWALWRFFGIMVTNGALAVVSDRTFDGSPPQSSPLPFVIGAFATAIVAAAFAVGERMRRDTAGLV